MSSARSLFMFTVSFALSNAFVNFHEDPACVPDGPFDEKILPFICNFEKDQIAHLEAPEDYDTGFDCTDLPKECTSAQAKATWALSKRYVQTQGSDRPGCGGLGNVLSREAEFPDCIFGRVPETTVLDLSEVIQDSRQLAEKILSGNPTNCAARLALGMYDIYAQIGSMRLSEAALHGPWFNPKNKLAELQSFWDASNEDCGENITASLRAPRDERLQAKDWTFDRSVFGADECETITLYKGSSFAKDHNGGLEGCKVECINEPKCNAFNMELVVPPSQPKCELLACPSRAKKSAKYGYVSYTFNGRANESAEAPLLD